MRVGNETRPWREGEAFAFDDSFEHEVWHSPSTHALLQVLTLHLDGTLFLCGAVLAHRCGTWATRRGSSSSSTFGTRSCAPTNSDSTPSAATPSAPSAT